MLGVLTRARIFVVFDLAILIAVLGLLWTNGSLPLENVWLLQLLGAAAFLILTTAVVMGLYRRNAVSEPRFTVRCLVTLVACGMIVAAMADIFAIQNLSTMHLVGAVTLSLSVMMILRVALHRASDRAATPRRLVTVLPEDATRALRTLLAHHHVKLVPLEAETDETGRLTATARQALLAALDVEQPSRVILCDGLKLDPELAMELARPRPQPLRLRTLSAFMADEFGRLPHDDPETLKRLVLRTRPRSFVALAPKRIMDVVISLLMLIALSPVMLVTAAIVRLSDGGPALYRQTRVGRNQRPFTLLKFRSMRVDAEANGVARWAERRDSRVTRFGSFMRLTRLDELPQLLNVLSGDMSLVGPRPERPEMIATLKEHIPAYDFRHLVPPGLTGWAQINYPYGASIDDAIQKTSYDLYYVTHRSCIGDALILLETIRVVLFAEGSR